MLPTWQYARHLARIPETRSLANHIYKIKLSELHCTSCYPSDQIIFLLFFFNGEKFQGTYAATLPPISTQLY